MEPRQILAALPGGGPAGGPGRAAPRGTDTTARLGLRARRGRGRRDPPHRPAAAADPAGPAGPRPARVPRAGRRGHRAHPARRGPRAGRPAGYPRTGCSRSRRRRCSWSATCVPPACAARCWPGRAGRGWGPPPSRRSTAWVGLRRYPGAAPVVFGDAERREAIVTELRQGLRAGVEERRLDEDAEAVAAAAGRAAVVRAGIAAALDLERRAADLPRREPLLPGLRVDASGALAPGFDVARARKRSGRRGWWARWWLRRRMGAAAAVPLERLSAALEAAAAEQAAALLAATGGTDLGPVWPTLLDAQEQLAAAVGRAMRDRSAGAGRCRPGATGGASCSPASTATGWCGRCRCGWVR